MNREGRQGAIARYEQQAEKFLAETEEEYYLNGAGLKDALDLAPIYRRHETLFTLARAQELLEQINESRTDRYLAQFAASQYLDRSVCDLTAQLATAETQATIEWRGEHIPYRMGIALIPHEADPGGRRELDQRVSAVTELLNPMRAARLAGMREGIRALGFAGCADFCQRVMGLDLAMLREQTTRVLAETDQCWQQLLATHMEEARESARASIFDLRYALTGPQYDELFPGHALMPALHATFQGLGIDIDGQRNLHLDTEERRLKSQRPFCCAVRVPDDIRLVMMARGGREDYNHLLHEAGHAVHLAFTDGAAPFAFRCLGDNSVTEAYAFLFNLILRNPHWLREVAGTQASPDYLSFARFYHLYQVRRLSGRLGYELELHAGDLPPGSATGASDLARSYCEHVGKALGVRMGLENYLADVDDLFYCARYLRAWMLEVQLRNHLTEKFGGRWFAAPEAGAFLRGLWSLGQELTAEEVAQRLGYDGLDARALAADLLPGGPIAAE